MSELRVKFEPDNRAGAIPRGSTVLEAAAVLGVPIAATCGGNGKCGKCLCFVREGATDEERGQEAIIGTPRYAEGLRLACRTRLLSDAVIEIAEAARGAQEQILEDAALGLEGTPVDVPLLKRRVTLTKPALTDQRADLDRLLDALAVEGLRPARRSLSGVIPRLAATLRESSFEVTCVLCGGDLIAVEPGDTTAEAYGVAIDIGTTSVVAYLVDLIAGRPMATASCVNPQVSYGDDVVSRITHIRSQADGLHTLTSAVRKALEGLLTELCEEAQIDPSMIYRVTTVGNATMTHLLWGADPSNIAQAPYIPVTHQSIQGVVRDLGLSSGLAPHAPVFSLPNIAGWIGADTVGVILSTRIHESPEPWIAIDIGTNGEIVVGSRDRLIACSAAAGPAFEGAQIHYGMRATSGAIDHVITEGGRLTHTTIGAAPARGICGSGLFDIMAALLQLGCVNEAGVMVRAGDPRVAELCEEASSRLTEVEGDPAFVVAFDHETSIEGPVVITQRDVRQIQLAKAAIAAGIQIALQELRLNQSDIRRVILAGAFGSYVRPESAAAVGVFPKELSDRAAGVGNAAGAGARLALISEAHRLEADRIIERVEYLELATRLDFNEWFAEEMMFAV